MDEQLYDNMMAMIAKDDKEQLYKIKPLEWKQGGGGSNHFIGLASNGVIRCAVCTNADNGWRWIYFDNGKYNWQYCDSLEHGKKLCEFSHKMYVLVYVEKA